MKLPRILIAAPRSGSGKTLTACGLMKAMKDRGLSVRGMKCGPDYIDPMFHETALGIKSRNLDSFLMGGDQLAPALAGHSRGADITVIEGVMGYYDGIGAVTTGSSSYETACLTHTPVLLVMDAEGASVSLIPMIRGICEYRRDSGIAGIILNHISGKMTERLSGLIEKETGIPVVGSLEKRPEFAIKSRHLGLMMPGEIKDLKERLELLSACVEESFHLDRILEIAEGAPELPETFLSNESSSDTEGWESGPVRIALARDEAFCFLYEDNEAILKRMGAEIIPFSPLHGTALPEGCAGLILPGGYPELYAGELSRNESMRASIRGFAEDRMPIMAECGGFLYLHRELRDREGNCFPMAGVLDAEAWYAGRSGRFGYITLTDPEGNRALRAHEFHAYESSDPGAAMTAVKPYGGRSWRCMHLRNGGMWGFPHLYYPSCPEAAGAFLDACRRASRM